MTRDQLATLARRLLDGCRDSVTGEKLYGGESSTASVEDVEAAARYLRDCAEAEPVATVRVHDTGGNAGIAWSGVPTENAGVMRGGTPLYAHPHPPAQATPPDALDALRRLVAAIIDDDGDDDDENAPGHAHWVPGVWDDDNHPSIAGLPCELCAAWRNARAVLAAHDEKGPR